MSLGDAEVESKAGTQRKLKWELKGDPKAYLNANFNAVPTITL